MTDPLNQISSYIADFLNQNQDEAIEFLMTGKIGQTLVDPLAWELLPDHLKQKSKDETR